MELSKYQEYQYKTFEDKKLGERGESVTETVLLKGKISKMYIFISTI